MRRPSTALLFAAPFLVACAWFGAAPASAHDLWLSNAANALHVHYGHPDDLSLPDKARLFELDALSRSGAVSLLDAVTAARAAPYLQAPLPAQAYLIAGRLDNGFWTQTPQGMKNTNRRVVPGARSLWSMKFAKLLLPGAQAVDYAKPIGHRLELVPLADPFTLSPGQPLRLRVLFEGKPLPGAKLESGVEKVESDANGEAALIPGSGETLILTSHRSPGTLPDLAADDTLGASLAFRR